MKKIKSILISSFVLGTITIPAIAIPLASCTSNDNSNEQTPPPTPTQTPTKAISGVNLVLPNKENVYPDYFIINNKNEILDIVYKYKNQLFDNLPKDVNKSSFKIVSNGVANNKTGDIKNLKVKLSTYIDKDGQLVNDPNKSISNTFSLTGFKKYVFVPIEPDIQLIKSAFQPEIFNISSDKDINTRKYINCSTGNYYANINWGKAVEAIRQAFVTHLNIGFDHFFLNNDYVIDETNFKVNGTGYIPMAINEDLAARFWNNTFDVLFGNTVKNVNLHFKFNVIYGGENFQSADQKGNDNGDIAQVFLTFDKVAVGAKDIILTDKVSSQTFVLFSGQGVNGALDTKQNLMANIVYDLTPFSSTFLDAINKYIAPLSSITNINDAINNCKTDINAVFTKNKIPVKLINIQHIVKDNPETHKKDLNLSFEFDNNIKISNADFTFNSKVIIYKNLVATNIPYLENPSGNLILNDFSANINNLCQKALNSLDNLNNQTIVQDNLKQQISDLLMIPVQSVKFILNRNINGKFWNGNVEIGFYNNVDHNIPEFNFIDNKTIKTVTTYDTQIRSFINQNNQYVISADTVSKINDYLTRELKTVSLYYEGDIKDLLGDKLEPIISGLNDCLPEGFPKIVALNYWTGLYKEPINGLMPIQLGMQFQTNDLSVDNPTSNSYSISPWNNIKWLVSDSIATGAKPLIAYPGWDEFSRLLKNTVDPIFSKILKSKEVGSLDDLYRISGSANQKAISAINKLFNKYFNANECKCVDIGWQYDRKFQKIRYSIYFDKHLNRSNFPINDVKNGFFYDDNYKCITLNSWVNLDLYYPDQFINSLTEAQIGKDIKNTFGGVFEETQKFFNLMYDVIADLAHNDKNISDFLYQYGPTIAYIANQIIIKINPNLSCEKLIEMVCANQDLLSIIKNPEAKQGLINILSNFMDEALLAPIFNIVNTAPWSIISKLIIGLLPSSASQNLKNGISKLNQIGILTFLFDYGTDLVAMMPTSGLKDVLYKFFSKYNYATFSSYSLLGFLFEFKSSTLSDLLLKGLNMDPNSEIYSLISQLIINNPNFNITNIKALLQAIANPAEGYFTNFINSISYTSSLTHSYNSNNHRLTANFQSEVKFNQTIKFNAKAITNLLPNKIKLGSFSIDINKIRSHFPRTISFWKGQGYNYYMNINNQEVKPMLISKTKNDYSVNWFVQEANSTLNIKMPRSVEEVYHTTSGMGVGKVVCKLFLGFFYNIIYTKDSFNPFGNNNIISNFGGYHMMDPNKGYFSVKNNQNVIKNQIANMVYTDWTGDDNWFGSGLEKVKISQVKAVIKGTDYHSLVKQILDLSNVNIKYNVYMNASTIIKGLNVLGIKIPSVINVKLSVVFDDYIFNQTTKKYVNRVDFVYIIIM